MIVLCRRFAIGRSGLKRGEGDPARVAAQYRGIGGAILLCRRFAIVGLGERGDRFEEGDRAIAVERGEGRSQSELIIK